MTRLYITLLLAAWTAAAAERPLGQLPGGRVYIQDEIILCLKADTARGLSRADIQRRPVDVESLRSLHPAIERVIATHLSAERWVSGEPLPTALKHRGADVPEIARTLTVRLNVGSDAAEVVPQLQRNPNLEWASLNLVHQVTHVPNDTRWSEQWGPLRINATNGWDVPQTTTALRVAIVDTGVDLLHPDLASRIVYQKGFAGNTTGDAMRDMRGGSSINHGTHVAGTAAAIRNNNLGIAGVVDAGIMAMGCATWNSDSQQYFIGSATDAINDAIANSANVINCSFAQPSPLSSAMNSALNTAQSLGVLVICAAGNDATNVLQSGSAGWSGHVWPVLVSNVQADDTLAPLSNYGLSVHLGAPGSSILSTVTTNYMTPATVGTYGSMGGTSMASPHVAGAAALVWSMNPLKIAGPGTRDLLFRMAEDLGDPGIDASFGFGMLQVPAIFLSTLKSGVTFAGTNSFSWIADGTYEKPYSTIPSAIGATPAGGTIILNGGIGGITPRYPAQTITSPVTLSAFPDRPVTIGH